MWPIWFALKRYAPYVTFPVALVVGFVGYNMEELLGRKETKDRPSVQEKRVERFLATGSQSEPDINIYKTIFDKPTNISPSLKPKT